MSISRCLNAPTPALTAIIRHDPPTTDFLKKTPVFVRPYPSLRNADSLAVSEIISYIICPVAVIFRARRSGRVLVGRKG
jgi:hypothetical protein